MVLGDLGNSIAKVLSKLNNVSKIDTKIFNTLLNEIQDALLAADVNMQLIQELKKNIKKSISGKKLSNTGNIKHIIDKAIVEELTSLLGTNQQKPFKHNKSNVIMLVGLQGSGKTTTCVKLAHYYKNEGYKVAVICADTFRAGAFDQLMQNATKASIPYYGRRDISDPVVIAIDGVRIFKKKKFEIIIVDTSGRHKQEEALFVEMESISNAIKPDHTIFVLDSTIGQAAQSQAVAFKQHVNVGSVIITKLDGHAKGGGALSAVAQTGSPITFIGVGEHMNELQEFDAESFVSRMLGRGDVKKLVKIINKQGLDKQTIPKGKCTMGMLKAQFENVLKMGSMSQLIQMIPGLNNLGKESGQESQKRLHSFMMIMDSMTEEELKSSDVSLMENDISRKERICRGSGVGMHHFDELLVIFKQFSVQMKCMNKMQTQMNKKQKLKGKKK
eukprot:969491_1